MRQKIKTPHELKPTSVGKKIKLSITIDEEYAAYLEVQSETNQVSVSKLINEALKLYIEYSNKKK